MVMLVQAASVDGEGGAVKGFEGWEEGEMGMVRWRIASRAGAEGGLLAERIGRDEGGGSTPGGEKADAAGFAGGELRDVDEGEDVD